jgi:hypothetical protein
VATATQIMLARVTRGSAGFRVPEAVPVPFVLAEATAPCGAVGVAGVYVPCVSCAWGSGDGFWVMSGLL